MQNDTVHKITHEILLYMCMDERVEGESACSWLYYLVLLVFNDFNKNVHSHLKVCVCVCVNQSMNLSRNTIGQFYDRTRKIFQANNISVVWIFAFSWELDFILYISLYISVSLFFFYPLSLSLYAKIEKKTLTTTIFSMAFYCNWNWWSRQRKNRRKIINRRLLSFKKKGAIEHASLDLQ